MDIMIAKTSKVMLVSPPYYKPYSAKGNRQVQADSVPLGLGYIASYILQKMPQVEVKIIDYGVETFTPERWRQELQTFNPQVVGISVLTLGYPRAMALAKLAQEFDSTILTVAGGPHATIEPEQCLKHCDIVVRGEGEQSFHKILQGQDEDTIQGISYRRHGAITHHNTNDRIQDLDSLPFPATHLFQVEKYREYPGWGITSSRGCPYNCLFCASPRLWGHTIKFRSIQNVVDEIEYLHSNFGIKHIIFQDDALNYSQARAFEMCNMIISRGLHKKVTFECPARANKACVSLDLFKRMKEANFVDISFGVESGSDKVLKLMHKSLTTNEARQAIKLARQANIPTITAFFMIGNWGETVWDVMKTWWFVLRNNVDMVLTVCTPLPGTEFNDLLKQHGYLNGSFDWSNTNWITPLNRTDKMSQQCIQLLYYLTVIFVHLPSCLLRGKRGKARDLVSNIVSYTYNKVRGRLNG